MSKVIEFFGKIGSKFSALSKAQKVVTAAVTATSLVVAGGGAVLVSSMGNGIGVGTETSGTEFIGNGATEVVGEITVRIETVSIEKDLKIKVVDENGTIITGVPFEFKVAQLSEEKDEVVEVEEDEDIPEEGTDTDEETASEGETPSEVAKDEETGEVLDIEEFEYEEYVDEDLDGIVHILNLTGGEYLINMADVEGYIIEANTIKANVKNKIEYKKVDVENEVKKESEVNTAIEDTAINNVVVEAALVDTLPLLATHVASSEVSKDKVDTSNFPKASKGVDTTWEFTLEVTKVCTEHIPVETKENEVAATCTTAGSYTKVVTCSRCNAEVSREDVVVDPLPHTPGTAVVETSETGEQFNVVRCTVCNAVTSSEPVTSQNPDQGNNNPPADSNTGGDGEQTDSTSTEPTGQSEEEPEVTAKRYMGNAIVTLASAVQPISELAGSGVDPLAETGASQTPDGSQVTGNTYKETVKATVVIPFSMKLYRCSEEAIQATLDLNITDEYGIVDKANIHYESTDSRIVSVKKDSTDPTKAVVRGVNKGTQNIQVTIPTWTDETKTQRKYSVLVCTVQVDDYTGDAAVQIKDKDGNLLYTDSDCRKPATAGDYIDGSVKLYGAPQYTGWNVINGKLYYFTADHKPATGYQVIGGVAYTFNSDGSVQAGNQSLGIDVSKWQGNIDWTAVAQSGVKFAIIRCAYRGASTGVIVEDPYFRQNIKGATANGIKVGVYFFTQAVNEYEAIEEASTAIGLVSGYNVSYPIFIDTENATNGRANGLDVGTRTAVVRAFCETVRNAGYKPGIYASKNWYYQKLDMSQLSTYNIWVAQYNTSCNYTGRYDIWQYSSDGSIPGINGRVDVNIGYTNY